MLQSTNSELVTKLEVCELELKSQAKLFQSRIKQLELSTKKIQASTCKESISTQVTSNSTPHEKTTRPKKPVKDLILTRTTQNAAVLQIAIPRQISAANFSTFENPQLKLTTKPRTKIVKQTLLMPSASSRALDNQEIMKLKNKLQSLQKNSSAVKLAKPLKTSLSTSRCHSSLAKYNSSAVQAPPSNLGCSRRSSTGVH